MKSVRDLAIENGAHVYDDEDLKTNIRIHGLDRLEAICEAYHLQKMQSVVADESEAIDAARYRFLRGKYAMANFDIYDAEVGEERVAGIIFELPKRVTYSADVDKTIDDAIRQSE